MYIYVQIQIGMYYYVGSRCCELVFFYSERIFLCIYVVLKYVYINPEHLSDGAATDDSESDSGSE